MKILICVRDVFTSIGGGQSFYANLFERNPQHVFYYFTGDSTLERKILPNAHALQIGDHYRLSQGAVDLSHFTIAGRSLASKTHDILYLLDLANSALGLTFDVIDIPDFQPFGAAFPQALRTLGVKFDRVAVSMHGTLTAGMTDNWAEILDADSLRILEYTEMMLYKGADIRYAISRRYLRDWENKTDIKGQVLDLSTLFPYQFFSELRALAADPTVNDLNRDKVGLNDIAGASKSGSSDVPPALVFIGRQEKFKGPHLFVDMVAGIPATMYSEAMLIGPEVNMGGLRSRTEIDKAADRRGISVTQREMHQKTLWSALSQSRWVTVMPSYKDTLNLAALESLMAGAPAVVSIIAGLCDYLDEAFPGIPYTRIDPNNLTDARRKIADLLRNYENERARLITYLKDASPKPTGLTLDEIYTGLGQPVADTVLYEFFAPVFNYVLAAAVDYVRPHLRDQLSRNLHNIFRAHIDDSTGSPEVLEFVRRITHSYDQAFELRRYSRELLEQSGQKGFLSDAEMEDVWTHLLPYCFTNNRVALYKLMSHIERDRGASLISATYAIRCLRLGGQIDEGALDDVTRILIDHGFQEEAQAVRWMYGSHFDYNAATAYLRGNTTRFFAPPIGDVDHEIDSRHSGVPKVSIIVSLYNAASKLSVFFEGLSNLTERTKNSLEIVLIDSCSPDNTADVVLNLKETHLRNGWNINLYYQRTSKRESIQRAWNRGISLSRGAYLSFLGVDEMNRPDAYDIMTSYLDANPSADWVQGSALVTEVNPQGSFVNDLMIYDRQFDSDFMQLFDTCYVGYVGALYRRTIHDRVGLYDDRFKGAGDSEFKNRALPFISIVTLPEVLGYFLNYPEERTTQSPNAEIEDLRAWYLFRTSAGVSYGFSEDTAGELNKVFYKCLRYRKSYMGGACTDIELATSIADFVAREGHASFRQIFAQGAVVGKVLEIYRVLDLINTISDNISDVQFLHEIGGIIERAAILIASSMKELTANGIDAPFLFDNDNRSHQHHNLWRSRSPKFYLEVGPQFSDLAGPQDLGEVLSACQSRDTHVDFERAWSTNSLTQLNALFKEDSIDIAIECDQASQSELFQYLTSLMDCSSVVNYVVVGPDFGTFAGSPRVYTTGKVRNPRPVLAAAKVVVVLNDAASSVRTETHLLRAICMGKPIVTFSDVLVNFSRRLPDFDSTAIISAPSIAKVFEEASRLVGDHESRRVLSARTLQMSNVLRQSPNCISSNAVSDILPDYAENLSRILQCNRDLRDAFAADGIAGIKDCLSQASDETGLVRKLALSLFATKDAAILKTQQEGFAAIRTHPILADL